jgi:hypothetical protein
MTDARQPRLFLRDLVADASRCRYTGAVDERGDRRSVPVFGIASAVGLCRNQRCRWTITSALGHDPRRSGRSALLR